MMLHEKFTIVKQNIIDMLNKYNIISHLSESWRLSWPMIVIMFCEFSISMTDIYIGGKLGKEIQASVGVASQVYIFFVMAGHAVTIGAVAVISRLFTAGDLFKFRQAVFTTTAAVTVFSAIVSVCGVVFAKDILKIINVPEEIMIYAEPLLEVYSIGLFFHLILVTFNAIMRSARMMKLVMKIFMLSSIINIILNIVFIFYTSIGFVGLALSTTIAIFVSFLIASRVIYRLIKKTYSFSMKVLKQILSIGWPSGVVAGGWQLAAIVLYMTLAKLPENSVDAIAAYAIGLRIESAIYLLSFAFNMANATIVGNLLGQKRYDEAYNAGLTTAFISVFINIVMTLVIILNANNLASVLSDNALVIEEIMRYLYIVMLVEPFIALNLAISGGLIGAGDTRSIMRYSIVTVWMIRIPLSYILGISLGFGVVGIWWGLNIGFLLQAVLTFRRFRSKKWAKEL